MKIFLIILENGFKRYKMNVIFHNQQQDLLSTFPGLEPNHMFFQLNTSEQQRNLMKIFLVNLEIRYIFNSRYMFNVILKGFH